MSTHVQSAYVRHAISHPSKRLVVTAPRQTGLSYAIAQDAISNVRDGDMVAIITINGALVKETQRKLKSINAECAKHVTVANGYKFNDDKVACIKGIPVHKFAAVYVDLAGWHEQTDSIVCMMSSHQRIVLGTTGSNTDKWLKRVDELTEGGFTAIFINVPRHPMFKKQRISEMGEVFYHREYKVNTGAQWRT